MGGKTSELNLARRENMVARAPIAKSTTRERAQRTTRAPRKRKRTYRRATKTLETALTVCALAAALLGLAMAGIAGSLEIGRAGINDLMMPAILLAIPLITLTIIITRLDRAITDIKADRRRK